MKSVNVRQLKNNPSDALRMARKAPLVIMNRDHPEALLFHLDDGGPLGEPGCGSSSRWPFTGARA
jgi:hypothetical protein